jgi:predicted NUDIX family NTP pyrophosphohydrolase
MAKKMSAGLLLFRPTATSSVEVMLAHMGGPFWAKKDAGGWSIPKGEYDDNDQPLEAARREFMEEIGQEVPPGDLIDLGELKQPSGKRIRAWAIQGDLDVSRINSNMFEMEWPPRSGRMREFPEIDRADWFDLSTARVKLVKGQIPFIDLLVDRLGLGEPAAGTPEPQSTPEQTSLFE